MLTRTIDYSDVIELLQHKIVTYIKLNPNLNFNIPSKTKFVDNTDAAIIFNFYEFKEPYRMKFIHGSFEDYSLKFIDFLKPVLVDFLKEVKYDHYDFTIVIRHEGEIFQRIVTVHNHD